MLSRSANALGAATSSAPSLRPADEVARWLVAGGDERIALGQDGRNRYGCSPSPEPSLAAFSSSTASTISGPAFVAAAELLEHLLADPSPREAYHSGAARVRERLAGLCGLPAPHAQGVVLGASGTDLHLLAADLASARGGGTLVSVIPDPSETGRGVPNALRGLRFGTASPHGPTTRPGEPLPNAPRAELVTIRLREPDGAVRAAEAVDADFEAAVGKALGAGGGVLLVLVDGSKTGLLAPTPACAIGLKRRYGEALTVLVDACQFRLTAASLRRYLEADLLVAVTGSKFVGGPPFCGALLLPEASLPRLRTSPLGPALADYSARADWPAAFAGRGVLPDAANFGLLLRWEAALHELEAFRRLPDAEIRRTLAGIGVMADEALRSVGFEALPPPRRPRFGDDGWDALPSVFPFLVRTGGRPVDAGASQALYEQLRDGPGPERILLGQPVAIGARDGQPVSALRLAISAGQVVEAAGPQGAEALAGSIRRTLAAVAAQASALG